MDILNALVLIIFLFSNTVFADLQSTVTQESFTVANFKANYGINPKPVYPPLAIKRGWEGVVYLRVSVSEKGMPFSVVVHKSTGHDLLDDSAVEAVEKWQFIPAKKGDKPIPSNVIVPITFSLGQGPSANNALEYQVPNTNLQPTKSEAYTEPNFNASYGNNPKPVYPKLAVDNEWVGKVALRVNVSEEGTPISVSIHQSSGHESLDASAVEAVWKWQFIPAKNGDKPVPSNIIVPINFDLKMIPPKPSDRGPIKLPEIPVSVVFLIEITRVVGWILNIKFW